MIFKFKQFIDLEENSKCPPGYKYDPELKMCIDKNYKRSVMYRPYFGRYLSTQQPKQEQPPKKNGNGNGNGSPKNGNGNNGNGNGGNGNGNGGGNGGGASGGNGAGA